MYDFFASDFRQITDKVITSLGQKKITHEQVSDFSEKYLLQLH